MSKGLTDRQREVLDFITDYNARNNTSPSLNEIATHFGFTGPAAWYHVQALQKKGMLSTKGHSARSIALRKWEEQRPGIVTVPLFGENEYLEGRRRTREELNISALRLRHGQIFFALRIEGNGMINEGIRRGDYVVFRRTDEARSGDIVLASPSEGDELVLRKYMRIYGRSELQAGCDDVGNIYCAQVRIHAVAHAMLRFYGSR